MNIQSLAKPATRFLGKNSLLIKRHSPELLLGVGLVGVGATVFLACRATLKAEKIIGEHKEKMEKIELVHNTEDPKNYSEDDYMKDKVIQYVQTGADVLIAYSPAILVGVGAVGCILASHNILTKRNIALAAAYKLAEEAFKEYRARVVNEFGKAKDFHFRYGTDEFEIVEVNEDEEGKKVKIKKHVQSLKTDAEYSMYARLFEPQKFHPDGSWTGSTQFSSAHHYNFSTLRASLNFLNDRLHAQGYLFLNDVYDELGFMRSKAGQVVGWTMEGDGDHYISFGDALDFIAFNDGDPILLDFNVDGNILSFLEGKQEENINALLLVDFNNVFYRAYYSQKEMHEKYPWLPVIRYFEMLRKCCHFVNNKYSPRSIDFIFAGESRTQLDRSKICPTYKAHRKPIRDDVFASAKKAILSILRNSGFDVITKDGAEADDVIASLVQRECEDTQTFLDTPIVIYSNDRDLRHLLRHPGTVIYQNPGMFFGIEEFQKEYDGMSPSCFPYYKALVGDKSDNIEGVFGWGPVKALNHIVWNNWQYKLEEEGRLEEYMKAFNLIVLNYNLKLDARPQSFRINDFEDLRVKLSKLYSQKGVDDIILSVRKFEEVVLCGSICHKK